MAVSQAWPRGLLYYIGVAERDMGYTVYVAVAPLVSQQRRFGCAASLRGSGHARH